MRATSINNLPYLMGRFGSARAAGTPRIGRHLEASARDACEVCHLFWCLVDEGGRFGMRDLDREWASRHNAAEASRPPEQPLADFTGLVTVGLPPIQSSSDHSCQLSDEAIKHDTTSISA
ncbi:hypothetical protein LX36DRAFT_752039 [Colletotrichum falcatum]|nr:hypothetical protein LX36DRAFT_752039 [Colletotrichum falcatum]